MNRGFLIIVIPAVVVGVCYLAMFRWMGLELRPGPFAGTAAAFAVGLVAVWRYQRRKQGKRRG